MWVGGWGFRVERGGTYGGMLGSRAVGKGRVGSGGPTALPRATRLTPPRKLKSTDAGAAAAAVGAVGAAAVATVAAVAATAVSHSINPWTSMRVCP